MTDSVGSMPFIKHEPDERAGDPNQYMMSAPSYAAQQQYGNSFANSNHNQGIDPSDLSMQNGNFNSVMPYSYGSQQNLSSSFNLGNSGFGDDELLEGLDLTGQQGQMTDFTAHPHQQNNHRYPNQRQHSGMSMSHQGQMANVYSSTPDGPPIQSPFLGQFDYSQFKSTASHMSPHQNPM